jgi:hypothetical protein
MALMWNRNQGINSIQNPRDDTVSRIHGAIAGYEFPDFIEVNARFGMKIDFAAHLS